MIVNRTNLFYWVYNADDLTSAIYSNANSSMPVLAYADVQYFCNNSVQSPPLDTDYYTEITYDNNEYFGVSALIVPYTKVEFLLIFL